LWLEASLGKKLARPYLEEQAGHGNTIIPAKWEAEVGRSLSKVGPIQKIARS
jgi:hypothetical protein